MVAHSSTYEAEAGLGHPGLIVSPFRKEREEGFHELLGAGLLMSLWAVTWLGVEDFYCSLCLPLCNLFHIALGRGMVLPV